MRIAANLTLLFTEAPVLDRPAPVRFASFDSVGVPIPNDHPPHDWQAALGGLPVALINTPPGNWAAGERCWAAVPGAKQRLRDGFARAGPCPRDVGGLGPGHGGQRARP